MLSTIDSHTNNEIKSSNLVSRRCRIQAFPYVDAIFMEDRSHFLRSYIVIRKTKRKRKGIILSSTLKAAAY